MWRDYNLCLCSLTPRLPTICGPPLAYLPRLPHVPIQVNCRCSRNSESKRRRECLHWLWSSCCQRIGTNWCLMGESAAPSPMVLCSSISGPSVRRRAVVHSEIPFEAVAMSEHTIKQKPYAPEKGGRLKRHICLWNNSTKCTPERET